MAALAGITATLWLIPATASDSHGGPRSPPPHVDQALFGAPATTRADAVVVAAVGRPG